MKTYICYCTAQTYEGFKLATTCKPTIIVEAHNGYEARQLAESKFIKEQLQDRTLKNFTAGCLKIESEGK